MYAIPGTNKAKAADMGPGAFPLGLVIAEIVGLGVVTSFPDPDISHPPPEQSRLHLVPSQWSRQFPPGQDIMHMSEPDSQYILQLPLVQVWSHSLALHLILVQLSLQFCVQFSPAVHLKLVQWPPKHELSQFIAVHLISQAPWAQVCSQRAVLALLQSNLHFPPAQSLSHFVEASHCMLQGPLQFWLHSPTPEMHRKTKLKQLYSKPKWLVNTLLI